MILFGGAGYEFKLFYCNVKSKEWRLLKVDIGPWSSVDLSKLVEYGFEVKRIR